MRYEYAYNWPMGHQTSTSTPSVASSSGPSMYTPSRSGSPTASLCNHVTRCKLSQSPQPHSVESQHQTPPMSQSTQTPHYLCGSCLEQEVKVLVHDGQDCPRCGTLGSGTPPDGKGKGRMTGKVHKRKVAGRHLFSEAQMKANGEKPIKDKTESHRRFLETVAISRMQNVLKLEDAIFLPRQHQGKGTRKRGGNLCETTTYRGMSWSFATSNRSCTRRWRSWIPCA
jgi:hypothetical protein